MSNNDVYNNSINNNVNMGDNNFNGNKNSIDQSVGKTIENKTYVKLQYPKRQTQKEREQEQRKTERPGLRDKENKLITCFGLVVCKYQYSDFYTVVNVVDKNGNYIADHIQLNFKEDVYDYKGQNPLLDSYIRFTGLVGTYPKSNKEEYCINITDKVDMTSSRIYYTEDIIDYEKVDVDYNNIENYLKRANITKIYDLIDNLRNEINNITEDILSNDFIFYYIVNQYFLNRATYNMYEGEFRDQGFSEECVVDILVLLGHILFDLKFSSITDLYDLFKLICYSCNILQGVTKLTIYNSFGNRDATYEMNPEFIKFCKYKLGCEGNRKIGKLWNVATLRKYDFQMNIPRLDKLTKDMMTYRSYHMLSKYI